MHSGLLLRWTICTIPIHTEECLWRKNYKSNVCQHLDCYTSSNFTLEVVLQISHFGQKNGNVIILWSRGKRDQVQNPREASKGFLILQILLFVPTSYFLFHFCFQPLNYDLDVVVAFFCKYCVIIIIAAIISIESENRKDLLPRAVLPPEREDPVKRILDFSNTRLPELWTQSVE